jgi:capsular exopolysaccharide synthesis family protein
MPGSHGASSSSITPRTLIRGLIRHWWHILGLWLLFSIPALSVIFYAVKPKYEAHGTIKVEPNKPSLYISSGEHGERGFAEKYLRQQMETIVSGKVLTMAINRLEDWPMIRDSEDPIVDLHDALVVENIKDTFLIRVSLRSTNDTEAYKIVKAVIDSYLTQVRAESFAKKDLLTDTYDKELKSLTAEIEKTKSALLALASTGKLQVGQTSTSGDSSVEKEERLKLVGNRVTKEEFDRLRGEYVSTRIELERWEEVLKQKEAEANAASKGAELQDEQKMLADAELDQRIETEFRNDLEVRAIMDETKKYEQERDRIKRISRRRSDPALTGIESKLVELEREYRSLWESKYEEIHNRLLTSDPARGDSTKPLTEVRQLVVELGAKKATLERNLSELDVENKEAQVDAIKAEFEQQKLNTLTSRLNQIETLQKQKEFEATTEQIRIAIEDPVQPPVAPTQNRRGKLMAAVPVVLLFGLLGLFLLWEIKAERVGDPEVLSTRVQSEVFALPPLPSAREVRKMRELENGSDQIDRFIQRLDHLRFAVCGSQSPLNNGRCVLITSAVGGEGKTTLAAQLAARCGNAGMSTLLIDADLRRASLGTLLDIPEGPGLSDVLKGEISAEEAVIPVQGGTFHLLLAGTPLEDVSRILHGESFGSLIGRLRELYDLIVIDSPPVLPVPDALILGQWADGAILASRFDVSRFPQVERARRQLDISGITVLGTVINGMRSADSYYGHYSYTRKKGTQPNPSNAS